MEKIWSSLKIQFRNRFDFILYGQRIGYINIFTILIDFFILLYSVFDYRNLIHVDNIALLLFLIFSTLIWQILSFIRDFHFYTKRTTYYNAHNRLKQNSPQMAEELNAIYSEGPAFPNTVIKYSETIDCLLQSNTPIRTIPCSDKEKRVWSYIKNYRDILQPFLNEKWHEMKNRRGSFYNEKKLCMASEFKESNNQWFVRVCKGCYYNSYLTNMIYTKKLSHQSGWGITPPANISTYAIRPFEKSVMSDHIGISTLAITADGYVIILHQNDKALTSTDRLMPSASGSVDFKDFHPNTDFRQTLITAAERELKEETNLTKDLIEYTKPIGFYRDLGRGGKPEFCCITQLNVNLFEINTIRPSSEEQRDDFETYQILGSTYLLDGKDFDRFSNIIHNSSENEEERPSLALFMCFTTLCRYFSRKETA